MTGIGEQGTMLAVTRNRRMLRRNTSRFLQEPHGVNFPEDAILQGPYKFE
jgi:hypothetical protein